MLKSSLFFIALIVFLIYSFSLNRPWLPFDESLIYKEELFPIPASFNEAFEVINSFVFNYHMLSMNSFFSNIVTLRSNQLSSMLIVFIMFFFKKQAFLYHLLQLCTHILNSILVFFIFKKSSMILRNKKELNNSELAIVSIFTLLWALHSTSTEAVLLTTNWATLLTYTFCLCFVFYEISDIQNKVYRIIPLRNFIASVMFFLLMCFTEYAYTLPTIIFFTILSLNIKSMNSSKEALIFSTKRILTYVSALFFYFLYSLANSSSTLNNLPRTNFTSSEWFLILERNVWLSPQIFLNFFKLICFPKTLSAYQSDLICLSDSFFKPFAIFSFIIYILMFLIPLICFFIFKSSKIKYISFLVYAFFFSCFPFLHIISPTYCLIADRYCYFPLFSLLLFVLAFILSQKQLQSKTLLVFLSCILVILTSRTIIRIQDWSTPVNFYSSAIKAEKNPLYQGHKLMLLADFFNLQGMKSQSERTIQESLNELDKAFHDLKVLKEKNINQPLTLKYYGLDYESLLLKTVYCIALIKKNYLNETEENILKLYEPYIVNRLDYSAPNEIAFYGSLLLKSNSFDKAKDIYEYAYKRFPFILEISLPLADLYLEYERNSDKAFAILKESYLYYPNKGMPMYKLLKYYERTNDLENQAKFAYLLGLREHSVESYQHSAQIQLDSNKLKDAKKTLDKLIQLNPNNTFTLFQLSRYLDLSGDRKDLLNILNKAYLLNKTSEPNEPYVTKGILESLININFKLGNIEAARKYFSELENMKELTKEDKVQLNAVKERLF